jgi:putative membrane protein
VRFFEEGEMSASDPPADPRVGLAKTRTSFATFRTQLALDRTALAWIRTTLTMASFGFALVGFFRAVRERNPTPETILYHKAAIHFGASLIVLAAMATLLAAISQWRTLGRLRRGEDLGISRFPLSLALAFLLAVSILVGLAALFFP